MEHSISFTKMHGLGNDFIIIDKCTTPLPSLNWAALAYRHRGIGCDQIILLSESDKADVKMRILNADGSEVEACGNATRCVVKLLDQENCTIETVAGILKGTRKSASEMEVEMGIPAFASRALPFAGDPTELSIGNPHLVFLIENLDTIDLKTFGPEHENHPLFPNRINVEIATILSPNHIQMRVWERGVGITQACGTGACAVAAAAIQKGLSHSPVTVSMPGGDVTIRWDHVESSLFMQGDAQLSFQGHFNPEDYSVNA
jgi:diaminopimelate epimerase